MWDGGRPAIRSSDPTEGGSDGHHDRAREANGRRTGRSLERAIRRLVAMARRKPACGRSSRPGSRRSRSARARDLLDAGCGAGLALSMACGLGATVSGIDAAAGMIAIARRRVPERASSRATSRSSRSRIASFDAVTGFNSFQYAASPEGALREARRVLRPGGRLVAATWAPPEMCDLAGHIAAVGRLLPPPPPGAPGPFALSADGALAALLAAAGFEPQATHDVVCRFDYASDAEAAASADLRRPLRARGPPCGRGGDAQGAAGIGRALPPAGRQLPDRQRRSASRSRRGRRAERAA